MKLAERVRNLAESATLAVSAKAARLRAEGIDVIGFGAGEPDFDTPTHIKKAALAAMNAGHTGYSKPASGIPAAKKAVCEKLSRENGLTYAPEQVIITAGGKMAVNLVMQALIDPGDEVIIPAPYWVSYPEMAKLCGGVPKVVNGREENDYKLTPNELRAALGPRTKLLIMNSPSNPSGVTYTADELRSLADVLDEHEMFVLSDEIYDRLVFNGQDSISFASISETTYRKTLTANAASKTYAMTGWRVGYVAGPTEIIKAMAKLQSQSTSGAATFNQHGLVEALTGDQSAVEEMRLEFQRRGRYMYKRLLGMAGVKCARPTGAFYCFPNLAATYARLGVAGSVEFADLLLEKGRVAVVPGVAFGFDGNVRLSFAASMKHIEEGLNRIEALLVP